MTADPLTKRQREVLDVLTNFIGLNRYSPTFEELALILRLNSLGTVAKHLDNLAVKGYIERGFNENRSIRLIRRCPTCGRKPERRA